jgi:type II secretion system protein H
MSQKPRQCLSLPERFQSGITLIELLVVVLILGIATAVASVTLFQTESEKLQLEGERLLATLQFARDEAALGGRVMAVSISNNEVRFLERDLADPSRWSAATAAELQSRILPPTFATELRIGAVGGKAAINNSSAQSHVVFLPIGVAAPFEIILQSPAGARRITADALGNLTLHREPA